MQRGDLTRLGPAAAQAAHRGKLNPRKQSHRLQRLKIRCQVHGAGEFVAVAQPKGGACVSPGTAVAVISNLCTHSLLSNHTAVQSTRLSHTHQYGYITVV